MNPPALYLELHVPSFAPAEEFYELLGFRRARAETNYMVMIRGADLLCFYGGSESVAEHSYFSKYPATTKRGYGVEVVINVSNLDETFEDLAKKFQIVSKIQLRPWGSRDFRVEDPFGFYVRVTEKYDPLQAMP